MIGFRLAFGFTCAVAFAGVAMALSVPPMALMDDPPVHMFAEACLLASAWGFRLGWRFR